MNGSANTVSGGDLGEKSAGARHGRVYAQLQSAILAGGFPPGQMLPGERELMNRYGVTRNTVRRALRKLTASGHLTCRPRSGYVLSPVFRGGKPVKTHAIGVIFLSSSDLAGNRKGVPLMGQAAADAGHVVMLEASDGLAERENDAIRRLVSAGMEGLVIAPARIGTRSLELERWIADGRAVVLVGHPGRWLLPEALARRCDRIDADNADGIRQIVESLVAMGHRTAGFASQEALEGSERFAAFKRWTGEFGLMTEPRWWIAGTGPSREGGRTALARLRSSGAMPTAVVCSHDGIALWLIDALREQGLSCPEDLSVTGFEGQSLGDDTGPTTLTTVNILNDRRAPEIMRLLVKQFAGIKDRPEEVRIPVSLVVRGSVAPPPRNRRNERAVAGGADTLPASR